MEKYNRDLARMAKGGGLTAMGDFFSVFSRLPMAIFTTHLFNSSVLFGLYELAFRITFFVRLLVLPGTYEGIRRFMPMYQADKNQAAVKGLLLYSLIITTILSVSVTSLLLIFAPQICNLLNKPDAVSFLRVLALTMPFYAFLYISVGALTGIHRVKYQVFIDKILVYAIRLIMLFAFMFVANQALRSFAVVWSFPIGFGIGGVLAVFFFLRTFTVIRDPKIKAEYHICELHNFSLPLAATTQIAYLMNYAGTFVISYYCTERDIGLYGIVTHLSPLVIVPLYSSIIVFGPLISELYHLGRHEELARHYKFITKWIFTVGFIIFLIYAVIPKTVLSIFGRDYTDSRTQICLLIMSLAQLFNAANGPNGLLIAMTGKPLINLYNTGLLMGISVVLCRIFVPMQGPFGGIIGAGVAQAIAIVGVNILYLIQVWRHRRMHPFSLGYLKPLAAGIISGGFVYGFMRLTGYQEYLAQFEPHSLWGYIRVAITISLCGAAIALIFGLLLYLFGFEEDDKFILRKVLNKIRGFGFRKTEDANGAYHGRD